MLHEKYAHVGEPAELLPLALRIARFKIMGLRRKVVRRGEHVQVPVEEIQVADPMQNPGRLVERKLMVEKLSAALGQLGERCRELIRHKLQGRTFPEIQKLLGVASINTIYTWDYRCRQQLLEAMGGSWEVER